MLQFTQLHHTTMIDQILSAAQTLRTELDAQEQQAERVSKAKTELLELMIAAGPACENTLRLEWGQIQRVTKTEWDYRDRGVTSQNKAVEVANKALAAAKKLLKGMEEAAKAAGKAKIISETVSLRVVRGK